MENIPEVMTTAEAAKALRCSTATIRRKLRSKELEGSVDMGRVTVRSVRALLGIAEPPAATPTATSTSTAADSDDHAT